MGLWRSWLREGKMSSGERDMPPQITNGNTNRKCGILGPVLRYQGDV